jgi:hypothetical protein
MSASSPGSTAEPAGVLENRQPAIVRQVTLASILRKAHSPGHKAIAVVLNFMNPVGAGRRAIGR